MATFYTQEEARAAARAEEERRAANLGSQRAQEAQVSAMNAAARRAAEDADAPLDINYTRTGTGTGGTQIVGQTGFQQGNVVGPAAGQNWTPTSSAGNIIEAYKPPEQQYTLTGEKAVPGSFSVGIPIPGTELNMRGSAAATPQAQSGVSSSGLTPAQDAQRLKEIEDARRQQRLADPYGVNFNVQSEIQQINQKYGIYGGGDFGNPSFALSVQQQAQKAAADTEAAFRASYKGYDSAAAESAKQQAMANVYQQAILAAQDRARQSQTESEGNVAQYATYQPSSDTSGSSPLIFPKGQSFQDSSTQGGTKTTPQGQGATGAPGSNIGGAAFQTLMTNLPPEQQWMKPTLQYMADVAGQSEKLSQASYLSGQENVRSATSLLGDVIRQGQSRADSAYADTKYLIKDSLNKQLDLAQSQKVLDTQRNADAKAVFDFNNNEAIRQAQVSQRKMVEKMTIGLALTGTAYDYAANADIARAENESNQTINAMRQRAEVEGKSFLTNQLAIDNQYTQTYTNAYQNFNVNLINSINKHVSSLDALDQYAFTNSSALDKESQRLDEKLFTDVNTLKKDLSTSILDAAKFAQQQHQALITESLKTKATALDTLKTVFTATGGLGTEAIQNAASAARAAGVPEDIISAFTTGKATVAGYNAYGSALYMPELTSGKFKDSKTKQDLGSMTVGLLGTNETQAKLNSQKLYPLLQKGLQTGNYEDYYKTAESVAMNQMVGAERMQYAQMSAVVTKSQIVLDTLEKLKNTNQVIYENILNRGLPYINASQDPALIDLGAKLTAAFATYRRRQAGTAVTESETAYLTPLLANMNKDSIQGIIVKVQNLMSSENIDRRSLLGTRGYTATPRNISGEETLSFAEQSFDNPTSTNSNLPGIQNDWPEMNSTPAPGEGGGESLVSVLPHGRVTQEFDTPVSSKAEGGLYSPETVNAWGGKHQGVDIALPEGTPIFSPSGGTVVAVGYEPGWGNNILYKDSKGAEIRLSHLSEIYGVNPGDKIKRGRLFAYSGGKRGEKSSGTSTGPHLDVRVKVDGKYVDPANYFPL